MPVNEKPVGIERPRAPAAPPLRASLQTWFQYSNFKLKDRPREIVAAHTFILGKPEDFTKMLQFKRWASETGYLFHPAHVYTPNAVPLVTYKSIDAFFHAIGFPHNGSVQDLE